MGIFGGTYHKWGGGGGGCLGPNKHLIITGLIEKFIILKKNGIFFKIELKGSFLLRSSFASLHEKSATVKQNMIVIGETLHVCPPMSGRGPPGTLLCCLAVNPSSSSSPTSLASSSTHWPRMTTTPMRGGSKILLSVIEILLNVKGKFIVIKLPGGAKEKSWEI